MVESNDSAPPPVDILRCTVCGNTVECKSADVIRFTKTGWPKCCGKTMVLLTAAMLLKIKGKRKPTSD
jgi:hypothetical protein